MKPVSHSTTTVTTDRRIFKRTAQSGVVYYTTIALGSHKTDAVTGRGVKTAVRTALGCQVHRVAPYPGARPVRIWACEDVRSVEYERVVASDGE